MLAKRHWRTGPCAQCAQCAQIGKVAVLLGFPMVQIVRNYVRNYVRAQGLVRFGDKPGDIDD